MRIRDRGAWRKRRHDPYNPFRVTSHLDVVNRQMAENRSGELPLVLDIGGEGRHPTAWNLNPSGTKTLGKDRGQPIPRHIRGRAEAIPFPDGSVDMVIAERTPLRSCALHEIARVVSRNGTVILRHAQLPDDDCHALALQIVPGAVTRQIIRVGSQSLQETVFRLGR